MVLPSVNQRMVGGRVLFTDSTHLKANQVSINSLESVEIEMWDYIEELDQAIADDYEKCGKSL
ncbi:hypothetical protein [Oceanobacillus profundus]|uniref:Uncharacterized protein n=1 Tax=Oceanobacillus profundus TaxID=372463 RepID=A0A417YHW5_9BACI|nr:hypothetical protein CHI07_15765 [Paenibacillus sp. 7884-2]RHW32536.1 hypothetical protein D1B32_09400 [Oceanobacillus profundus]